MLFVVNPGRHDCAEEWAIFFDFPEPESWQSSGSKMILLEPRILETRHCVADVLLS